MNNKVKGILALLLLVFAFTLDPQPKNSDDEIFLYRAVQALSPNHLPLNQKNIGSCVAVSHAGAIDALTALHKSLFKRWHSVSPESIYGGARNEGTGQINHRRGDGSSGYAAHRWLQNYGVTYQLPYDNGIDLTKYDVERCRLWGSEGNGGPKDGMNGPFDETAKQNPIYGARVTDLEELDTMLRNGFLVTVCSNVGFDSPRDKDGFCQPRGSWSHCMFVSGKRNGGRKGYLIQNSWGAYIKGDGPNSTNKYLDQPDGSFYIEPSVMLRILKANDSWALSLTNDFKKAELPTWVLEPTGTVPQEFTAVKEETAKVEEPKKQPQYICQNGKCQLIGRR